tara:strand:+ start:998 stop:1135 length:138 start_codon:yes stop_codon:yes gene_type:complete
MAWNGKSQNKTCCSSYNKAITTIVETLNRGDKEALWGVMYKKLLL